LDAWPEIDFIDDRDGCLFTVTVHRKAVKSSRKMDVPPVSLGKMSGKMSGKTSGKILAALKQDGNLTIPELASFIGVTERSIERNIKKLQEQYRLRRVGPSQGGPLGGSMTYNEPETTLPFRCPGRGESPAGGIDRKD
jgi:ATP-dependent DNA helicase RecG